MAWLLIALVLGSVGVYLAFLWETRQNQQPGRVVYHGSSLREQGPIVRSIIERHVGTATSAYALIEPGAGLAKMARYLSRAFSWKEIRAIELGTVVYWLGRILTSWGRYPISWEQRDIFHTQFSNPAVVYCYLTSDLLDRLYQSGALKGALVITLTFPIRNAEAVETIPLQGWQGKLFVYDFRTGVVG